MSDQPLSTSDKIQAFAAVVTTLGLLVTMFWEKLWSYWNRPILRPEVGLAKLQRMPISGTGATHYLQNPIAIPPSHLSYHRIAIANQGNTTARRVHVYATRLLRRNGDTGVYEEVRTFLPMCLCWSNLAPGQEVMDIAPHVTWSIDLCYIPLDPDAIGTGRTPSHHFMPLFLCLQSIPTSNSDRLDPGEFELQLVVASDNADAVRVFVRIAFPAMRRDDSPVEDKTQAAVFLNSPAII